MSHEQREVDQARTDGGRAAGDGGDATPPSDCTRAVDKDGDGYYDGALTGTPQEPRDCLGADCNDNDPDVNPGREEVCDGKDNDCDAEVDECSNPRQACGVERQMCLGRLNAPCEGNRDCDVEAGFLCHEGRCKLIGEDPVAACIDDDDCVTEHCDLASGRCQSLCEVEACGSHDVCGEPIERFCDDDLGCGDCRSSAEDDGCGCGLCAGYQCFDGQLSSDISSAGNVAEELQLLRALLDCFDNQGRNAPVLCTGFNTLELDRAIEEIAIDEFVCGDEHPGLEGDAHEAAEDLVGCGLFNLDELESLAPLGPGGFYEDCAWWNGASVLVGDCSRFPAER